MVDIRRLSLEGLFEILPARFGDERGFFSETYNSKSLADSGIALDFVQDNHSLSARAGVLRGLHFQLPPFAQDKLVRVAHGRIFDVAVDIRSGSPSFGKWLGTELSAEKWNQLLVPKGFAHGFLTLEPNTEVLYKVTALYSPEHERTIRYDDPDIGIDWPFETDALILSDKDKAAPLLKETATLF